MAVKSIHAHGVASDSHVRRPPSRFSLKLLRASLLATAAICAVMALPHPAAAQSPTGGNVVAGTAGIAQAGAVTNINQSSQKAIINWQGFSVGAQNTVNFNQPNSSSATLNRVIGNEQSVINGAINASGQVFIVNSAGVLFGKGAQVNVGGLVASTLDISNNDFMAGNYKFSGTSNASVVNQGRIRARGDGQGGGYVALLGKTVSNEGVIAAKLGTVAMASGEKITLNFGGDSLLDVTIDKGTLNALVSNKRAIIANGGQVILTAKAADQVLSAQVNNSGVIQARTMTALKGGSNGKVKIGKIKLLADGGTTNVSGKLDASAPKGGDGGFIETSGDVVNIADSAVITTLAVSGKSGTWLIDPYNITISSGPTTNGSFDNGSPNTFTPTGASVLNVAMLQAALANNNVVVTTGLAGSPGADAGDINVNAAVTWSASTTLTLTAARDININQAITATGASAGLVFTAANNINVNNAVRLDGAGATLAMTYGGNYNIRTPATYAGTITGLVTDKDGNPIYKPVLVQKVNPPLDTTNGTKASYDAPAPGEAVYDVDGNPVYEVVPGDQAIGPVAQQDTSGGIYGSITFSNSANTFSTNPNGLTINGQVYHLVHSMNDLVSAANTAPGGFYALGGNLDPTTDSGSTYTFSTAPISTLTGALDGFGHTITGLKVAGTGSGGLVGTLGANGIPSASISNLGLVNVDISATSFTGSLVGLSWGKINNVYATGKVLSTGSPVGGIVGINQLGFVTNAHADVKVTGLSEVGGLVGRNVGNTAGNNGIIAGSSATGSINAFANNSVTRSMFGGLVGRNSGGAILKSYATGAVLPLNNPDGTPIAAHVHNTSSSDLLSVGGLVGSSGNNSTRVAKIEDSFATGDANSADAGVGGLVGQAQSTDIRRSYATGNVYATATAANNKTWAGGLVGWFGAAAVRPVMEDSFATGDVTAPGVDYVGGLVGRNDGTVTRSFATGNVIGKNNVGGFVGQNFWVIASSIATGNVTGSGSAVGGFVGFNNPGNITLVASITGSSATGNVTGGIDVGGFAGRNGTPTNGTGKLDGVTALGNVTSANGQAGGLVGYNAGEIANAIATGDVSGGARTGGLVGWNDGPLTIIRDSYATGSTNPGIGLIGENTSSGPVTNSSYNDIKSKAREAAAAAATAQQAALAQGERGARTANAVTNNAQNSSVTPPDPALANAGASAAQSVQSAAIEESVKSVDDAVKADDKRAKEERERERRRTTQSSHRSQGSKPGSGLGATIRSIDVNGQRFNLENNAPKQDAPTQAPH